MSIDSSINGDDNRSTATAVTVTDNTMISRGQDNNNNDQITNSVSAAANAASSSTVLSTASHTMTQKYCYHTFEVRLAQLADYKEKYGDLNVPRFFKEYGNLGAWVSTQRRIYKKVNRPKSMTKDRICALEELDF
jgi:hypothetical protein